MLKHNDTVVGDVELQFAASCSQGLHEAQCVRRPAGAADAYEHTPRWRGDHAVLQIRARDALV